MHNYRAAKKRLIRFRPQAAIQNAKGGDYMPGRLVRVSSMMPILIAVLAAEIAFLLILMS